MSSHPSDPLESFLELELLISREHGSPGVVARVMIPGREGRLSKTWPALGRHLSTAQRQDLSEWMANVLDEAIMWKVWAGEDVRLV